MKPLPDHRRSDNLSTYLDDAGSFELLDADEERRQARQLHELRRGCWQVVLTEAALADRFLRLARQELGPEAPGVLQAWTTGAASAEDVANGMLEADPDGCIIERLDAAFSGDDSDAIRRLRQAREEYLRARNRFMCANLRLVVTVAKRYGRHHMPLADRVQEGNIGLLKAIDRFDPERGFRFSTYAAWWIRHAVTRALVKHGRTVRIPAHIHTLFTKARRARTAIRGELGRNPTLAEVAERINAPLEKVHAAVKAMELRSVGLDDPAKGEGGQAIGEVLPDEDLDGWADRIGERIDARLANEVIEELDDMAYDIVVHRFGLRGLERRTLRSLGEDYDLSRERIRQLQNKALQGLREVIESSRVTSLAVA
jgi:RNA polymerase primary sigma factor